jgi:hypothetical protein
MYPAMAAIMYQHVQANQLVVFSGNVYDCDLLPFNFNPADLTVTTNPLSPGASGAVAISYTLPGDGFVYFEAKVSCQQVLT